MSFLNAEWRKLTIANYIIKPEVLQKYVPAGTELDLWRGQCYISLVGFMFKNTKLMGMKIPFHSDFEEVNLRFYVKRLEDGEWRRGVVFIKEIVPKPALTLVANVVYKEHYETLSMRHKWAKKDSHQEIEYQWKKNNLWHTFNVTTVLDATSIEEESITEFITEHYWGYAKVANGITNEYEVRHPKWQQYKVLDSRIEVDFAAVYGSEFDFLSDQKPDTVMLAEGSEISVENKKTIRL